MNLYKITIRGRVPEQNEKDAPHYVPLYIAANTYGKAAAHAEVWATKENIVLSEIEVQAVKEPFVVAYE